jgi:hypothetical protein
MVTSYQSAITYPYQIIVRTKFQTGLVHVGE